MNNQIPIMDLQTGTQITLGANMFDSTIANILTVPSPTPDYSIQELYSRLDTITVSLNTLLAMQQLQSAYMQTLLARTEPKPSLFSRIHYWLLDLFGRNR